MASTRSINYSIRPNKHVERRMILEVLQRLDRLPPRLDRYRYVGFGGIFFTDFLLVHRHLGIHEMTSIEKSSAPDRFQFNVPLACIALEFGSSSAVLPRILGDLRRGGSPAIFWLDYDGGIDTGVTGDAELIVADAPSLSVLLVTLNCQPEAQEQDRVPALAKAMADEMPPDITVGAQLGGWKLATVSHRLVTGAIDRALADRNGPLALEEKLQYRQLFHFHYADNARMLTLGGILHRAGEKDLVDEAVASLPQVRAQIDEPLLLDAPVLTPREVRHLVGQMPVSESDAGTRVVESPGIPAADVARFVEMYRQYPLYAEIGIH